MECDLYLPTDLYHIQYKYNIHTYYCFTLYSYGAEYYLFLERGVSRFFMGAVRKYIRGQFSLPGDDIQPTYEADITKKKMAKLNV